MYVEDLLNLTNSVHSKVYTFKMRNAKIQNIKGATVREKYYKFLGECPHSHTFFSFSFMRNTSLFIN